MKRTSGLPHRTSKILLSLSWIKGGHSGFLLGGFFPITIGALLYASMAVVDGGTAIGWGGNEVGQISFSEQGVKAIAAGYRHSLLVRDNGTVAAYGSWGIWHPDEGRVTVPVSLDHVVTVAAGFSHSLALRDDGTVVAWGLDLDGQTNVPPGLSNVVQIAAYGGMSSRSLALTTEGRVVAWGAGSASVPSGLSNVVAVSAGSGGIVLKADGTVTGWDWGAEIGAKLAMLTNVVAISAGHRQVLALLSDQALISIDELDADDTPPAGLSNVVKIAASPGNDHHLSLALRADGTVWSWGYNFYRDRGWPWVSSSNAVAIASGSGHTMALLGNTSGTAKPFLQLPPVNRTCLAASTTHFRVEATGAFPLRYQWTFNGQPILGETNGVLTLREVRLDQAGEYQVIISNDYGSVTASGELRVVPLGITRQPENLTTFAGDNAVIDVRALGFDLRYQWYKGGVDIPGATNSRLHLGNVQLNQSGVYTVVVSAGPERVESEPSALSILPVNITQPPQNQVAFLHGSARFNVTALGAEPLRYQWRFQGADLPNATNVSLNLSALDKAKAGRYEVLVSNHYGSVLSDEAWLSVTPVASWGIINESMVPPLLADVKAVAAGLRHQLALKNDGTVVAWGSNSYGQTDVPPELTNVIAVNSGSYADKSMALTEDGDLIVWPVSGYPDIQPRMGLSNVVAMSVGQSHAVAVTSEGIVAAWGHESLGANQTPAGLSNVVAISAGENHNVALKVDGTVVCWGAGTFTADPADWYNYGQSQVPAGLCNVVAISAGSMHSMALRHDGTVVAWGSNWANQTNVPPEATNVVAIAAGEFHNLALRADGTVVTWGQNVKGFLTPPPDLRNVVDISAGGGHSLALIGDGPPVTQVVVEAQWTSDGLAISVPTRSGRVYALEYTSSLEQPEWKLLPLVAGNGSVRLLKDLGPADHQRFYRVRRW